MLELVVTPPDGNLVPTVFFHHLDQVSAFHAGLLTQDETIIHTIHTSSNFYTRHTRNLARREAILIGIWDKRECRRAQRVRNDLQISYNAFSFVIDWLGSRIRDELWQIKQKQ